MKKIMVVWMFIVLMTSAFAVDHLVSVSQVGYHPTANKQAIVYFGDLQNGTFEIKDDLSTVYTGNLTQAVDYNSNPVNCQGNMSCLVAYFTDYTTEGTYTISVTTNNGTGVSPEFTIDEDLYANSVVVFEEFFDAMQQQNSSYHADFHSFNNPPFTAMADGSFIMESYQAAWTLSRLGNAYRQNPSIFDIQMVEHMHQYINFLKGLQGVQIEERTDGVGYRINSDVSITNVFVPGPTNLTDLDIYAPSNPIPIDNKPVVSLCGADNGTAQWDECIDFAAQFYKCQIDEPCLNMTYVEKTGVVTATDIGYGVSTGWSYEFGCAIDIDFSQTLFDTTVNPCMILDTTIDRENTIEALHAYLSALPAINDYYGSVEAQELFDRAFYTYEHVKSSNPTFTQSDDDSGFWGASLFLLYNYTGNETILEQAYDMSDKVSTQLHSNQQLDREFYWEQYVLHKDQMENAGFDYDANAPNPDSIFRNKLFFDWKDAGLTSMDKTAERIYQYDHNIQFQNSRYMLTEGLYAFKAINTFNAPEDFIQVIGENQFSWLTGMNAVQDGVSLNSPIRSYSFIFGIGQDQPTQYHSRYLIDTGYRTATNGQLLGTRGTGLQFYDEENSTFVYLDAKFEILGTQLGSNGNGWRGEEQIESLFVINQTYNNGKNIIPGWINGPFDTVAETDTIFNYRDNLNTYEFTETTNEIVATAVEYAAYADAYFNNKQSYSTTLAFTPTEQPVILTVQTQNNASVFIDGVLNGTTNATGVYQIPISKGSYTLNITKQGYLTNGTQVVLTQDTTVVLNLIELDETAPVITIENPVIVNNSVSLTINVTDANLNTVTLFNGTNQTISANYTNTFVLPDGVYTFIVYANDTSANEVQQNVTFTIDTTPKFGNIKIISDSNVNVSLNGLFVGQTSLGGMLELDNVSAGNYTIVLQKGGYTDYTENFTLEDGEVEAVMGFPSPILGSVEIFVEQNASITFDNTTIVSNYSKQENVFAGDYSLVIEKVGYQTYEQNITVAPGEDVLVNVSLVQLPNTNATLTVNTNVPASVYLNAVYVGESSNTFTNLTPGNYTITVSKSGYYDNSTLITLNESDVQNISLELTQFPNTASVSVTALNTTVSIAGQTMFVNGTYVFTNITPGNYSVIGEKDGFRTNEVEVQLFADMQENVSLSLVPLQIFNETINITAVNGVYEMYETEQVLFTIETQNNESIKWIVNGVTVSTNQTNFTYKPNVLFAFDTKQQATIEVQVGADRIEWIIEVYDVINPTLLSPFVSTSGKTIAEVFVLNTIFNATQTNITFTAGSEVNIFEGVLHKTEGTETVWRFTTSTLACDTNMISRIQGINSETNETFDYEIPGGRSHFRTCGTSSSGGSSDGSSGGSRGASSGGGSYTPPTEKLSVVYTTFSEDILRTGAFQRITLDATSSLGNVSQVEVKIRLPDNTFQSYLLNLISGDNGYGTWSETFSTLQPGKYTLESVYVTGKQGQKRVEIEERAFYATENSIEKDLGLIYTTVNKSELRTNQTTTFTLDARDATGITKVSIHINTSRNESYFIDLDRIDGDEKYGTYQGVITASEPDTTMTIDKVILVNDDTSKTYDIENRIIYVQGLSARERSLLLAGQATGDGLFDDLTVDKALKMPIVPTLIGFLIMVLVAGVAIAGHAVNKKIKQ